MAKEPIAYIRDRHPPEWSETMTLEQWMFKAIHSGDHESFKKLINACGSEMQMKYRKLWKEKNARESS